MIRIAYIIDSILVETAGTEKQLLMLLDNLDRTIFKPYLCVLGRSDWLDREYRGEPYYDAKISSFKSFSAIRGILGLARHLRQERIDIVQTFFSDANKAGILAARIAGIRCVVSSRRNQGYWHTRGELATLKFFNRWVDLFLANSNSTRDWAQQAENIPSRKIKVIYNGLDLGSYGQHPPDLRDAYRREFGLEQDALVIGMVANLRPVKGHEVLLRAAQIVIRSIPKARFVIVGEGICEAGLRSLSLELGIAEHIRFLGPRTDVAALLSAFDIGVLTSNSESSSNAIVEYLASGLPVVSTDVGGAREAIGDGWNGFVVKVGDFTAFAGRILDIQQHDMFSEMGKRSRRRAEELFSRAAMVRQHEQAYQQLIYSCTAQQYDPTSPLGIEAATLTASLRILAKVALSFILGQRVMVRLFERLGAGRIIILTYHRINDTEDSLGLAISSDFFEQQLEYLKRTYPVISLEEAVSRLEGGNLDRSYVVLTFDDGFQDNYTEASPLLRKYDIPATFFVVCQALENGIYDWTELDSAVMGLPRDTLDMSCFGLPQIPLRSAAERNRAVVLLHNALKGTEHATRLAIIEHLRKESNMPIERVMMTWSQADEMTRSELVTIASHTVSHPILSRIPPEQALHEISGSKGIIEGRIGRPVLFFSYPNGSPDDFSDETVALVKSAGYRAALTTIPGDNRPGANLFRLCRLEVSYGMCRGLKGRFSPTLFAAYVSGMMGKFTFRKHAG